MSPAFAQGTYCKGSLATNLNFVLNTYMHIYTYIFPHWAYVYVGLTLLAQLLHCSRLAIIVDYFHS